MQSQVTGVGEMYPGVIERETDAIPQCADRQKKNNPDQGCKRKGDAVINLKVR
jgi:hypothetical protein